MSIDKIRNIGLDKLVTQVYDFESLTTDELMCKFAQKINIIIEHLKYIDDRTYNSDKAMEEKLEYLLGQGLEEQVARRLLELINNGTLGKLINETLLNDINEQLDNKSNLYILNDETNLLYHDACVMCIVDDDGERKNIFEKMLPLMNTKNIKCTFAIQTGAVGMENKLTLNDIKNLQSQGFDIVCHGYQHKDLTLLSYEDREIELKNAKELAMKYNFSNTESIVYPFGFEDNAENIGLKAHVSKYFKYGINAYGIDQHGNDNEEVLDNYYVKRLDFNNKSLDELKAIVDRNYSKKTLIVILIHSWMDDVDWDKFESMIDYAMNKNISILNLKDSLKVKGNSIFLGDKTSQNHLVIRNDGLKVDNNYNFNFINGSPNLLNKNLDYFPSNKTSIFNVGNSEHSPFSNFGGIVEVVRVGDWGYMKYKIYFNNVEFIKQWNADEGKWQDWAIVQNTLVGTTEERPSQYHTPIGYQYFDTTINKPIYHKGNGIWVDSTGTTV